MRKIVQKTPTSRSQVSLRMRTFIAIHPARPEPAISGCPRLARDYGCAKAEPAHYIRNCGSKDRPGHRKAPRGMPHSRPARATIGRYSGQELDIEWTVLRSGRRCGYH
jgi:hypothetical protein